MGSSHDAEPVRLTVPAQADFVSVLRVAVRVVAGRAGCGDDARSRLQAAVGTAFFVLLKEAHPSSSVLTSMWAQDQGITLELAVDRPGPPLDPTDLAHIGDGRELDDDGRTLRFWVVG